MKIKIKVKEGEIERVPQFHQVGNFQMMTVRYKNRIYIVGDGDEYIRDGYDKIFELGRCISGNNEN